MTPESPLAVPEESVVSILLDEQGVATVSLNRPSANNAYNGEMLHALLAAVRRAATDSAIRVLQFRGNGRHFQAGADLRWLREVSDRGAGANLEASRLTAHVMRELDTLPKPTIALVQGACMGGGTGLIASCDVVIAERDARFSISEARWGVAATIIFPQLNDAIGIRQVRRYATTCEVFGAARARELGLIHEICEPGHLEATAATVIAGWLDAAPGSIGLSKLSAMRCAGSQFDDATFERLVNEHADKRQSEEAREGLEAFAQGRKTIWSAGAHQ